MIEKILGVPEGGLQAMGASMQAAELGALASVADVLIKHGASYGTGSTAHQTGLALLSVLTVRVRREVLLMPDEKAVKPSQE